MIEPYKKAAKPEEGNIKIKNILLQDYAPVNPNVMNFKQSTLNEHFKNIRNEASKNRLMYKTSNL
jgi:hypothetical protein